ncbi:hypothetical protein ASG75_03915 [Rhodanobacter sp. Soil772]|uniref:hypothetical protein n=1 Tax=Rhodanobacter sp. Soil772 TaxID=1736406 RepID=UPI0006FCF4E6|nr:hypothetical protein [Rhodanobacter sp. Soil772]KRE87291.1 hypothetical protein ASG75_03915 [Rhodanobacter sp. Soil772]
MNSVRIKFPCFHALAGLALMLGAAHAQESPTAPTHWPAAVSGQRLDAIRGGFDFGNGLLASFGIERAVYINGNLVASSSVQVPDIGRMTPDQAIALAAATGTLNVIQNGAGNSVDTSAFNRVTAATVIQNSLDNQDIRSLTTIDAAVNSQLAFRDLNLQQSLQAGLIGSLGH